MEWLWLVAGSVVIVAIVGISARRPLRSFGRAVQLERARELFVLQRERLEAEFFRTAATTGKPRGLLWKELQWETSVEFARERSTGQLAALIPVTIRFEAVADGDMEGVAAVDNLRNASAVFFFHRGHWLTVGKAIFNMNPGEAIAHFKNQYESIDSEG
jgi:hypothetical protein